MSHTGWPPLRRGQKEREISHGDERGTTLNQLGYGVRRVFPNEQYLGWAGSTYPGSAHALVEEMRAIRAPFVSWQLASICRNDTRKPVLAFERIVRPCLGAGGRDDFRDSGRKVAVGARLRQWP